MAKKVMTVSTSGLDQVIAELNRVTDTKNFLPKTLYDGAGVVAKEMKTQISALKTSSDVKWGSTELRYPYEYEKEVLEQNFGIAPFKWDGDTLDTKVGFDGYYTNKKGQKRAIPLLANAVNAGTSFLKKQPFKDKTYRVTKETSVKAMQSTLNQEIAKLTK